MDLRRLSVVLLLVVSACGEPGPAVSTTPQAETTRTPSTSALTSSPSEAPEEAPYTCPNVLGPDDDRSQRPGTTQTKLHSDTRLIALYGNEHIDVFGGLRFTHDPSRIEVTFTHDLDEHCESLREIVAHPDAFDVVQVAHSLADKHDAVVAASALGASTSGAGGWGPVRVRLPAFAVDVAERLDATYGDMLEITVGGWPYPPPDKIPVEVCPVPQPTPDLPLDVTIVALDDPYRLDRPNSAELTVAAAEAGTLEYGELTTGLSIVPGQPASLYTGSIIAPAYSIDLASGAATTIVAHVGLTPCTLEDGYVLPAGAYVIEGPFEFTWNGGRSTVFTEPVAVTVEAMPPTSLPPQEPPPLRAPTTTTTTLGS